MVAAGHRMAGLASVAWAFCYAAILTAVPRARPALAASPPPPPPPPVVCVGEDISLQELADEGCEIVQGSVLISGIGAGQTDGGTVSNALLAQVTGDFTISGSTNGGLVVLDFSTLESVGGALVSNDQSTSPLQVVSFDALTTVGDTLEFSFNSDLQNLGLTALANVGGPFTVNNNAALATLDLPQLSTVGGALSLTNGLDEVSASALESVGGNFQVQNTQIASLEFDALASVGLTVDVQDNADLVTFALPALTSAGSLSISDLASLSQLELGSLQTINSGASFIGADTIAQIELPQLQQIGGDLVVANNLALETFSASQLQTIGNDMTITGNPALAMLDMPQLEDVNNILTITSMGGSAGEVDLSALGSVENGITLENNPGLVSVDLGSLNNVAGDLLCSDNAALAQIDLAALTSVNGNLIFTQNANLPQLNIDELSSVQQSFSLESNAQLQAVSSGSLQSIGGGFVVTNCDALAALALPALASVSGSVGFVVSSNSALQDLSGGTSQLDIGGPLNVTENGELATLSLSCATVGANVSVTSNAVLENATLAGLQSVGGVLDVLSNPRLSTLDVRSLASVGGSIRVEGNGADAAADSAATPGSCTVGASSGADVGGAVSVESNEAFAELRLGIRTTADDFIVQDNDKLGDGTYVTGLRLVMGMLIVQRNVAMGLLEVSLPAVSMSGDEQPANITGNVTIFLNAAMVSASFGNNDNPSTLVIGGAVSVTDNVLLDTLLMATLTHVGAVGVLCERNALAALRMDRLSRVVGPEGVLVRNNTIVPSQNNTAATAGDAVIGRSLETDFDVVVEESHRFRTAFLSVAFVAGSVRVQNNGDLSGGCAVVSVVNITGNLTIRDNNWLERVQALQTPLAVVLVRGVGVDRDDQAISDPIGEIGGHVNVSNNTVVASFSMAGIVAVGQEFAVIDNESLQNVTARSLSTVGAYLWVQFNPVLDTLLIGDLLDAGRDVNVTENGDGSSGRPLRAAGVVDFGQLDTVGLDVEGEGFDLVRSDSFETLDIAKIRLCGIGGGSDFRVVQNMQLAGTLYVEAFERSDTILVHQNPVLEHMLIQGANLSLPLVDSVRVTENAELLDIAVLGLENVAGEYYVNDNGLLEEALFQMWRPPPPPPPPMPTASPSGAPTSISTPAPAEAPTVFPPVFPPVLPPVRPPVLPPTGAPTNSPTAVPTTAAPVLSPASIPTGAPTSAPLTSPSATSASPEASPTTSPTGVSVSPSAAMSPTGSPTSAPAEPPGLVPTELPTSSPAAPVPVPAPGPIPAPEGPLTPSPAAQPTEASPTSAPAEPPGVMPTEPPTSSPAAPEPAPGEP